MLTAAMTFFGNILEEVSDDPSSIFTNTTSDTIVSPGQFCICVGAALILGFLISLIYIVTHRKEGYSQSYVMTIIMLPAIIALILILINFTAGALTLAGAFTLVRFRSVAGDPKDIAYIFYAMATGVACGIGYIGFALIFFIALGIVMFILSEVNFGASKANVDFTESQVKYETISWDKMNMLRHLRFIKSQGGIEKIMQKHAALLKPKFDTVCDVLEKELAGKGAGE